MNASTANALSALMLGGGIVWLFAIFMLFLGWPLLAFAAVRSLGKIRRELERLNNTLESKMHAS